MKVLLISRNAWNQTSSNTLTNFFQDFKPDELAQVYCRDELPDNNLCGEYFKITENQLVKTLFKNRYAGEKLIISAMHEDIREQIDLAQREKRIYDFFRSKRLIPLLWAREFIWKLGKWKSPALTQFVSDFNPDVIYTDAYDTFYTYNLVFHIQKIAKVPIVLFHCDDQLTFRQFSISPLFWINRVILRNKAISAIQLASINYCIIDKQKEVYQKQLRKEFKILNKCAGFTLKPINQKVNSPLRIIYAGNIYYGRWKTLVKLVDAIENINRGDIKVILDIYTANTVSSRQKKRLHRPGNSFLKGYLPYEKIREVQSKADILLHIESFNLKEKLVTSLSFSTKLVDYFEAGKCILAIGWERAASIEYLKKYDAALVVSDTRKLKNVLTEMVSHPKIIKEYSTKAFQCGKLNHEKSKILESFRNDLNKLKQ